MDTTKLETITQQLIEKIIESVPTDWDKVMFYGENRGDHAEYFYYFFRKDSPEFLPDAEMHYILDLEPTDFYHEQKDEINNLILKLAGEFKALGREPFTTMKLMIDDAGGLDLIYGYDGLRYDRAADYELKFTNKFVVPEWKARGGRPEKSAMRRVFELFFK
ncbi:MULTISPECIES: immunity protein YezG family protein [Bhargavaea]|uniref:Immunity protein YezG family protein n=1 Tax=Bhargavaea changchunensis TaxID=2134037 RepID=A0ABW2NDL0_9BACL|nr:immunity protein YezG family protein [Bhargavaea sp. CC-171006]